MLQAADKTAADGAEEERKMRSQIEQIQEAVEPEETNREKPNSSVGSPRRGDT